MNPISLQTHLNGLAGVGQLGRPELELVPIAPQLGDNGVGKVCFQDALAQSIEKVNCTMLDSDQAVTDLATGESSDVHGAIIAMQKADISFKMLLEARGKVMDAYQEVMRMQA